MQNKGFTLVEMMVSLFIGAFILAGVMFTFISMKTTSKDTLDIGDLQESGRLAINIMQRDIEQVGFWGTFYEDSFTSANTTSLDNPTSDCYSTVNNGSFPDLSSSSNFRSIYAETASSLLAFNCIASAKTNSDILQLKFLQGERLTVADTVANDSDENYFIAQQEQAEFVRGSQASADININASIWPYSHHIYYIADQTYQMNNTDTTIPVLMRKRLQGDKIVEDTIMEGVENMRFIFGLDTNADGRVDGYRSISDISLSDWENRKRILTVQIFLLVRTIHADNGLTLKNQTYVLGEDSNARTLTFDDDFRRAVFTTTIRLNNVGANLWKM
ncbi:PilW family protein [Pseudoalteromonas sp. MMG010]|uniref:PilW family protein n=1 Tax=Pseudoalteromonas sp. MMG010 TaxID=2822685 RepID=UPI001B3A1800|nr:PilW family protein [Pseudoalteromonas sp. MMG010]MBQ4833187.1 PilW family protein [Pseudoalteromonas sp. MMG010]